MSSISQAIGKPAIYQGEDYIRFLIFGEIQLWYIWATLFTYMIAPFLNIGIRKMKPVFSGILIFSFWFTFQICNLIPFTYISDPTYGNNNWHSIFIIIYGYLLGAFLGVHGDAYFRKTSTVIIVSLSIILGSYFFSAMYHFVYPTASSWFNFSDENQALLCLPNAFAIFSLFKIAKIRSNKFLNFIAANSILIYFFYGIIGTCTNNFIDQWNRSLRIYRFLTVLSISYLFAMIFYYPYIKFSVLISKWINQTSKKIINE